jgi:hypothetical protein
MKDLMMRKQELAEKINLQFDEVVELFGEETLESMYMVVIIGGSGDNSYCGGAQCTPSCNNHCNGANCVAGCSGTTTNNTYKGVIAGCDNETYVGSLGCSSGSSGGNSSGSGSGSGSSSGGSGQ